MIRIIAKPIKAKDLKPGDLFSTAGPEYWSYMGTRKSIGEKVYVRTDAADPVDQGQAEVFRIVIVKQSPQLEDERWLVWSNEHRAWWGWSKSGYVQERSAAGRYSYEEALAIVESANKYRPDAEAPNEAMVLDEYERQQPEHGAGSKCPIEFCGQCEAEDTKLEAKDDI